MTILLNLGGTITLSYVDREETDVGVDGILSAEIPVINISPTQSHGYEWDHLRLLRQNLLEEWRKGESCFIVSVGTDALQEVAYFLRLVAPPKVGIAVVGALRARSDPESDGPGSLRLADDWLRQACCEGVVVSCDWQLLRTPMVDKIRDKAWHFQPWIHDTDGLTRWVLDTESELVERQPRIPILTVGIATSKWLQDILESRSFDGVVIQAYTGGDVPPPIVNSIHQLVLDNIPVVIASRSRPGMIEPWYPTLLGTSGNLLSGGVLGAGWLDGNRARIRLMIALSTRPSVPIKDVFQLADTS
jgi:L-asparaginase